MAYERVNWENLPSTKTPVNADNLNKLNDAIDQKADSSNVYTKTETDTKLDQKQDKLIAGTGIEITGENIINNLNENYSTNEQKIGKWINGKPLYRKVIIINNTALNKGNNTIAHGISNMDKGIKITCFNYGGGTYSGAILPYIELNADSSLKTATFITRIDSTNIFFRLINDSWGAQNKWCVIIEYTKTTD